MATSGIYTLALTGTQMVEAILRVLGVKDLNDSTSPSANEASCVIQGINMWLFQKKGPPHFVKPGEMMWTRETADLTLATAGISKVYYDIKPSGGDLNIQIPVQILTATVKDTDGNETPLVPMTLEEYQIIGKKTDTGTPTRFYYEKRLSEGRIYFDVKPYTTTTDVVDIVYRQPLEIITAGANEFDIEDYWYRAIKFGAALDVATEFNVNDQMKLSHIRQQFSDAMLAIGSFAPENDFIHFQPGAD